MAGGHIQSSNNIPKQMGERWCCKELYYCWPDLDEQAIDLSMKIFERFYIAFPKVEEKKWSFLVCSEM